MGPSPTSSFTFSEQSSGETPTSLAKIVLQEYQKPPAGDDWDLWIFKAGRNTGKTLTGGELVMRHLRQYGRRARVGIMAPTQGDVIATCAEGETGIISLHRPEFLKYNRATQIGGEAFHRDGGYVRFLGGDKPARWNGPQWSMLWIDEAELVNPATIDQAEFGLRLGAHPRAIWTTTPKGSRYVKERQSDPHVVTTRATMYMNTFASPKAVERLEARYGGTSLGKSQLMGEDLDVPEGAIWPMLGETRERYLTPMPAERQRQEDGTWDKGLHFVRSGAGVDWGITPQHLAVSFVGSVTREGVIWMRRAWGSGTGSSNALIQRLKEDKKEARVSFAAIDRSQWSLADYVENAGITAVKGDRDVEWRNGLVRSALEQGRLFFDANDEGVRVAYDFLTQYRVDDAGKVVEVEDDYADGLAYLTAEFEHPTMEIGGVVGYTDDPDHRPPRRPRPNEFDLTPRPEGRRQVAETSGRPGRQVAEPRR